LLGTAPIVTTYDLPSDFQLDANTQRMFATGFGQFSTTAGEQYNSLSISSYGMQSFTAEQTLMFPGINATSNFNLSQWGADGFAFGVSSIFYSGNGGLYLLRSSALAGSATTPVPAVT
jgi:hypothetical protein